MEDITNNNFFRRLIEESEQKEFSSFDVDKWQKIFESMFGSYPDRRLPYSQITSAIYKIEDPQKFDQIRDNFSKVREATIQWDLNIYGDITDKLEKVEDHIQLAITQRSFILSNVYELDSKLHEKEQELDKFKNKLWLEEEKVEELQNSKTKIYTEFVTILGIFTTIIFASFGGLRILESVLSNISGVDTEKLLLFSSLTIAAVIMILFILLNGVAKLTGLNLKSCGCDSNVKNCPHNTFQKHPTFVASLMTVLYAFIIGGVGYFVDYQEMADQVSQLPFSVIILILLILPFAMVCLFHLKRKEKPKS